MRGPLRLVVTAMALAVLGAALPVSAQSVSRAYVGASLGPYHVSADEVTGTLWSGGISGGVRLTDWVDLEFDVARPAGTLSREHTGTSISFAGPGASREEIERLAVVTRFTNQRRVSVVFSAGAAFHGTGSSRRVQPSFFVGVTNHRVTDRRLRETVSLPPGVTLEQVLRLLPAEEQQQRTLGSLSLGAGVEVTLTSHLSLLPDVRYDYGSIGDEINNALRSRVRLLWRF